MYAYNGGYQAQFDAGAQFSSSDFRTLAPLPDGPFYALAVSWGENISIADLFATGLLSPPGELTNAGFEYIGDAEAFSVARGTPVPTWTYLRRLNG